MENFRNKPNEYLGVNKAGRNIKKSPLLQPNFGNAVRPQPPYQQPQIYNISKNNFRAVVQQLTGSPMHEPLPRPANNPPKPQSRRLQKIRPPPLTPINRPPFPVPHQPPFQPAGSLNGFPRPQQSATTDPLWANTAESPVSAYMRYLMDAQTPQPTSQPQSQQVNRSLAQPQQSSSWLASLPPLLPSPTAQFLLPSPTGLMNVFSPRSPYPLLSPGLQFPPPPTPNFSFSPVVQPGILGPGPLPPSPGSRFPQLSPSGLLRF